MGADLFLIKRPATAGLVIGRYAYKTIITVPKAMLVPTVAFMTMIGTYAIRNSISDIIIMILLGVVGWILNRYGFSASPIVLGLILGRIAEQGFVQAWTIGAATDELWKMFFGRLNPLRNLKCGADKSLSGYPFSRGTSLMNFPDC